MTSNHNTMMVMSCVHCGAKMLVYMQIEKLQVRPGGQTRISVTHVLPLKRQNGVNVHCGTKREDV